ncbi:hypothetical protein V6R21_30720 [Limibacter armeniacum]|uniref:hypothetical protein n=1 Tax=Limibacter armeniacum TaxID=466084 RepID=UPI002FE66AB8
MKWLFRLALFFILTVLTQVGGMIYLITLSLIRPKSQRSIKRLGTFVLLYAVSNLWLVPQLARLAGREPVAKHTHLEAASFVTNLCFRNYVRPQLNEVLAATADKVAQQYPVIKVHYLDANFPFLNGFPLIPHLSHNDGKKVDLSFIYQDADGKLVNEVPTVTGYGVFEAPKENEKDTAKECEQSGYWQYSYARYLTMGTTHSQLSMNVKATRYLLQSLLLSEEVGKVFLEPHLVKRTAVQDARIRFHGCHAVRHDDHIHLQLR